jgi:hypothetical protein
MYIGKEIKALRFNFHNSYFIIHPCSEKGLRWGNLQHNATKPLQADLQAWAVFYFHNSYFIIHPLNALTGGFFCLVGEACFRSHFVTLNN